MKDFKFELGDKVRLGSGVPSPVMMVIDNRWIDDVPMVECLWFDKHDNVNVHSFYEEYLDIVYEEYLDIVED